MNRGHVICRSCVCGGGDGVFHIHVRIEIFVRWLVEFVCQTISNP